MKLTVVGCGDAWGSGGRGHTCFRLDVDGRCVLADFGATALVAWHRLGFDPDEIDAIAISHLHGDHFGGLPFLLMECQFELRRTRPLTIAGPPGLRERLGRAIEVLYPGVARAAWRFDLQVEEVEPGGRTELAGLCLDTARVVHESGAPSTAIRIAGGGKTFAYSGDTEWTPALLDISRDADLFVTECYSGGRLVPGHIDWPTLRGKLGVIDARRVALTHLGPDALAKTGEFADAGLLVLADGMRLDV